MKLQILLLSIIMASCKVTLPSSSSTPASTTLFNGKDLSGWTIHGTEKWYVENKLLTCENGEEESFGYLSTNKSYKNFELNLDFKQQTNKGNGGVFVHSTVEGAKIKGLQVEIGPPGHNTAGIHAYDSGWLIKPDPAKDASLKMDKWNHLKILLKDDKMIVWLNDTEMVSLTDPKVKEQEGVIALQINKGDVTKLQWRNIEIIEL